MKFNEKKMPSFYKQIIPEIRSVTFDCKNIKHLFVTAYPSEYENPAFMLEHLIKYTRDNNLQILSQFVFGDSEMGKKEQFCSFDNSWPVTCIHGDVPNRHFLYGTQLYSISGSVCTPVLLKDKVVGVHYEDEDAEYCFLGDIYPEDKSLSPFDQTIQTFENIKKALELIGMNFLHVTRTWFYLDKLHNWYAEFNKARTIFFEKQGVFDHLIPASTGIGAGNSHSTHLVANVLAIKPKHKGVRIVPVPSPMQCEATEYKSSFSRAVEIQFPTHRQLYISGTASIDSNGNSVHIGNVREQINTTMKVVEQIIESRSMSWSDAVRAIAYFKDIRHITEFCDYCQKNHIPSLPVCYSQSDICRQELLFEIEIDMIYINDTENCAL